MTQPNVSATFAALGDPTRLAILSRLAHGEATVSELAEPFDMSMPAITKHLKVLENAGLITRGREAQTRPCRIDPQGFKPVEDWVEQHRRLWEASFDRLDDYLKQIQRKQDKHHGRKQKTK
jgi:DNA-binding transcriptional ArsR family regulator